MPVRDPQSVSGLVEALNARPIRDASGTGRLFVALPSKRRWRLHIRLEAVFAALLLNAVLLMFIAQVVFVPAEVGATAFAEEPSWLPYGLLGTVVLADLALYATLFTRRDPVDLLFDERAIEVRSGTDIVRTVVASDIRSARWRWTNGGWAILEVDVETPDGHESIRLVDIAYAGGRVAEGERKAWSSAQLDALVALIDTLAQQAAGRRGSVADIPVPLRRVQERAGSGTGR